VDFFATVVFFAAVFVAVVPAAVDFFAAVVRVVAPASSLVV
jgi:hypothetical protein